VPRAAVQFAWDMILLIWICICYPFQRLTGRTVNQLKTDGLRYIPKAYLWNLLNLRETIRARSTDFLSDLEMQRFHERKASGRL
jgi:hypothetical protein